MIWSGGVMCSWEERERERERVAGEAEIFSEWRGKGGD